MAQIKQQYYVLYCNANICKGAFYNARVAKIENWIIHWGWWLKPCFFCT